MAAVLAFDAAVSARFENGLRWGGSSLGACDRALRDQPDCAAARFAAAMVFTARQAFGPALAAASAGAASQSRHAGDDGDVSSPSIGLHWLRGLLLLRERQIGLAIESFAREIDELQDTHTYAGEVRVSAQVAAGFAHLAAHDATGAVDVFRMALETVPRSGRALVGMYMALQQTSLAREAHTLLSQIDHVVSDLRAANRTDEAALIAAAAQGARGDLDGGCATLEQMLDAAPPGHAGWQIPIDPALASLRGNARFSRVLERLAARAT